jgi:hypothetical protein
MRLVKAGVVGTTDKSTTTIYTTTDTYEDHGTSSDLWGTTWAVSDINAANFGAAFAATKASAAGAAHTVSVDHIRITVYYVAPPSTLTQASYRLFSNVDAATSTSPIDVGTPLAPQNTAATIPGGDGQPFRVRIDVGVTVNPLGANNSSFKLQYAVMSGTCDTSFTGETYADVTDSSAISYYDNPIAVNGLSLATNANDPTDGTNTLVRQAYEEKGATTFTNPSAIPVGQDGMWDFALTTNGALQNTHYCLRLLNSIVLNAYTVIPEIITSTSTFSQDSYRFFQPGPPVPTFAKSWGAPSSSGMAVIQTSDGGYAMTGRTVTFGPAMFLAKYDSTGTLSWSRTWDIATAADPWGFALVQTSDGGYAVTGSTDYIGISPSSADMFLAKYTSTGTLSWSRTWGGAGGDFGSSLVQTSDGGYIVAGVNADYNLFLVKYDSTGTITWSQSVNNIMWRTSDAVVALIQTSDGGYAVTGTTYGYGAGGADASLVKLTSTGTLSWSRTWGGPADDKGNTLIQTSDGGYLVGGYTASYGAGDDDMFVAKFTSTGTLSWSQTCGSKTSERGVSLTQTSDGGFALFGFNYVDSTGIMAKYDSTGTLSWSHRIPALTNKSAVLTTDGGYVVAESTSNGATLVKLDAGGNMNGCGTACTNTDYLPPLTTSSPTATTTSPTPSTSIPAVTTSSPTATTTSPQNNKADSTLIALGYSASVGLPYAAQNTPYTAPLAGIQFRLRLDVGVSNLGVSTSGQLFKLQYTYRNSVTSCSALSSTNFADVTTTTAVYYYDNLNNATGDGVNWSVNDPTDGSNVIVPQTYSEANNFSNTMAPIYSGESGEWDFSLAVKAGSLPGIICLRAVTSTGTTLTTYNTYPEIQYGPIMPQYLRHGMWWDLHGLKQNYYLGT